MDRMELVRHRRSVRTFDSVPLSTIDMEKILAFANAQENPYHLEISWKLINAGEDRLSVPVIAGTDMYLAGKMQRTPHAEEAFGYAFERVILYAESIGIGTTWIAGTMDRKAFEKAIEIKDGEVMPCISPLGYPAARMSLKETVMRKGIHADSRRPFSELFFDDSFSVPLTFETAGELARALEMVRWAPSAVNRQPWRVVITEHAAHFYEKQSKGYVDESGWDIQKIDMGIALCHFAYGLEETGRAYHFELADPGITSPEETFYVGTVVFA